MKYIVFSDRDGWHSEPMGFDVFLNYDSPANTRAVEVAEKDVQAFLDSLYWATNGAAGEGHEIAWNLVKEV